MKYGHTEGSGRRGIRHRVGSQLMLTGAVAAVAIVAGPTAGALASAKKATAAKTLPTVNLDYTAPATDLQLPLIAEAGGFFKKYGVNVNLALLPQSQAIPALVAGQIQLAAFQSPAPEVQLANGTPLKWVMQWENHSDSVLMSRSGINSLSQLSGKTIGITSAGSTSQVLTQLALNKVGVTANLQPLGSVGALQSAFQAGSIQAAVISPPETFVLRDEVPGAKFLLNYSTQFAWPGGGIAGLTSWTSKNAATTEKVIEGMIAAINYMRVHPAAAEKVIATADDETVAQATVGLKDTLSLVNKVKSLEPNAAAEKDVLNQIKSTYPGAASLTPASTYTLTFIKAAEKKVKFKVG